MKYNKILEEILPLVQKPARYIGNEWNSITKESADVTIALAYPDVYEVGISNLGLQILYSIVNDSADFAAERVFAPWPDMEAEMRRRKMPLLTLETKRPVAECDIFGFTLQYEMTFTNILNMLNLADLPLLSRDRNELHPLVIGGGPCAYNPEPLADYFDAFAIGEAEELVLEILSACQSWKEDGSKKKETLLKELASIEGVYVPKFYANVGGYTPNALNGVPPKITKRVMTNFDRVYIPLRPVVSFIEAIHDRCMVEIMRGCTRGCRFCQAGMAYRPFRERSISTIKAAAQRILSQTGYDEISLVSLSSTDHSQVLLLINELVKATKDDKIAVSLPSLRTDRFSIEIAGAVSKVRKTGLTFAPEAGSERLRRVINKGADEEDLLETAKAVWKSGWRRLKLYFMIGLPTEEDNDIQAIIDLAHKVLDTAKEALPRSEFLKVRITVSVSTFVPKAHTPFQWYPMIGLDEIQSKQDLLKNNLRHRQINLKWHNARISTVEGALARGGREMNGVIYSAWKRGCKFDGWDEHFSWSKWKESFRDNGLEIEKKAQTGFKIGEALPWEHISCEVDNDWLIDEYKRSLKGQATPDCRDDSCSLCGVCQDMGIDLERAR